MSSVELVVLELEGRVNVMPMPDELENEDAVWSVAFRDGLDTSAPISGMFLAWAKLRRRSAAAGDDCHPRGLGRSSTHRRACRGPWTAFE
jgi:hypothetical protein